ncbi:TPA: hypothetical protein HA235_01160 [Candidatus Woesearchaeota archaeon]|nr:hypothetical protein [Candidatus Woesearchaeota archaeon]HIH31292.1 hypothetical protein [Candidatus Woesearchaeota archaeon]HIH55131.1 hypothetical protein [Candidatus Woesearchaeota archaeon]HIJ01807.1 hypothetical protein [Candidatus Woesearchaeota archaeon]HIJ14436.1 hypothetical protein [Candidatus Woesearchaeota archaeon]
MDRRIYAILAIFAIIVLVSGCGTKEKNNTDNSKDDLQDTGTVDGTQDTTDVPVVKTKYNQLFDYAKTSNFQYRISTNIDEKRNSIDTDYVITSEKFDAKDAWLLTTSASTETGIVKTNMWIDKSTHKCLKWESAIENGEQKTQQPGACPVTGLNSAEYGNGELSNMGSEEVNVPVGIFNATRYELEGITFWTVPTIGVPVKVVYNDGTVKMVLMKYS